MVQGSMKKSKGVPAKVNQNAAKFKKRIAREKEVKKGNTLKLPKKGFLLEAMEDRDITKAIGKSIEQKIAAKVIQGGTKLELNDVMKKGKQLNREINRSQVKKKLTRVEEKLQALKTKAEEQGLI